MARGKGSSRQPEVARFVASSQELIAPWLSGFGFSQGEKEVTRDSASLSFVNGARYVSLYASSDPRDPPTCCRVVLGEGSLQWPEVDWNGIALWQMARAQADSDASEYPFGDESAVPELVERIRTDLEKHGLGFLRGDTAVFRRVRAEINRTREPYMIHRPNGDGTYRSEADPVSAELKARFS